MFTCNINFGTILLYTDNLYNNNQYFCNAYLINFGTVISCEQSCNSASGKPPAPTVIITHFKHTQSVLCWLRKQLVITVDISYILYTLIYSVLHYY